jgi:tetratricopeptide (TPR) repeat protein
MPSSGTKSVAEPASAPVSTGLTRSLQVLAIVLAIVAAYSGTMRVPFFFDDLPAIVDNPTIRHLGDMASVLSPPSAMGDDSGASGRPFINLSFALNYACGGLDPWGYHATNLAIHIASALLLYGIVRRTCGSARAPNRSRIGPSEVAFATALLWGVHPLLTESVTCVVQRTESLMGLCYLAALYCFVRHSEARETRMWAVIAFTACLLGMATKEAMVTAPVVIFLYDRTFVSGGFRESWRRHRMVHGALAATWFLLAVLVLRDGSSRGFGHGAGGASYLLTQCRALVLYLKLSVWPHPLAIDYGTGLASGLSEVWPQALCILVLLGCSAWCLVSRPVAGFLMGTFFILLSPSSSFVPLAQQTIAEHRMYLPLAALAALAAGSLRTLPRIAFTSAVLLAGAALAAMTWERNLTFSDPSALWAEAVRAFPSNERAHNNLGYALASKPGRLDEAISEYREALRLKPDYFKAHTNLANALVTRPGGLDEAIAHYTRSLEINPLQYEAHYNLACALEARGIGQDQVISHLEDAVRLRPDYAEAHANLGYALQSLPGRLAEAISHYETSLQLKPDSPGVLINLALAELKLGGRRSEAEAHLREAIRLDPTNLAARRILESLARSTTGYGP